MISRPTSDQLWVATAVRRAACRRPASAAAQRSAEWARRLWREGPYPDDVIVALEALAPLAAGLDFHDHSELIATEAAAENADWSGE